MCFVKNLAIILYATAVYFLFLGLSFIVMFLISILELIPEGIDLMYGKISNTYLFLISLLLLFVGYIFVVFIDNRIDSDSKLYKIGILSMVSLLIHNIPEGIICAISSVKDIDIKCLMFKSLKILCRRTTPEAPKKLCIIKTVALGLWKMSLNIENKLWYINEANGWECNHLLWCKLERYIYDKYQYIIKLWHFCEKNVTVSSQEELKALTGTDLDVLFVQEKEDECDRYEIKDVDFGGIRNLRFNELANIHIYGGKNFPKDMDFSNCYAIVISHAEFNGDENIKWASLSDMNTVRNIPASTDLSKCRSVKLDYCKFCEDGELKLGGVCNLDYVSFPKKVDFSRCDEIYSEFRNGLYGVEEIKFKNKAQKRDLIYKLGEFENKVVYEDVEKNDSFADKFMNLFGRGMW